MRVGLGKIGALEITFDNIVNIPATIADASSVSDWNTLFSLPTYGTPFTSVTVVGNTVKLYGGSGITIPSVPRIFDLTVIPHHISMIDYAGCIIAAEEFSLAGSFAMLNNYITTTFYLPALVTIGDGVFGVNMVLSNIYIPSCTNLGTTTHRRPLPFPPDDSVFANIHGQTITLTIPAALMTCWNGTPDSDILYLQENNTVTIITT